MWRDVALSRQGRAASSSDAAAGSCGGADDPRPAAAGEARQLRGRVEELERELGRERRKMETVAALQSPRMKASSDVDIRECEAARRATNFV